MSSGCKDTTKACEESVPVLGDIKPADITDLLLNNPGLSILEIDVSKYFKCGSVTLNNGSDECEVLLKKKIEEAEADGEPASNTTQSKDPKQKTIIRGRINEPAVLEEIKGIDEKIEGIIKQIDVKQIDEKIKGIIKQVLKLNDEIAEIREKAQGALLPDDAQPVPGEAHDIKEEIKLSKTTEDPEGLPLGRLGAAAEGGGKRKKKRNSQKKKKKSNRKNRKSKGIRKKRSIN